MPYSDREIVEKLKSGDQVALKYLFDSFYKELVIHSIKIVANKGVAEEAVQDVFIQLWKNRENFSLEKSFHSYLFTAVKNRSLNYLKSRYGKIRFDDLDLIKQVSYGQTADEGLVIDELREKIQASIDLLPPKCKVIFTLSRNSELTTTEIANHLGLSKKTVQAQISIALRKIKDQLGDWLIEIN